ncbi:ATP-dependent Lon protease [Riemerella anatipestifer]|uniref:ATP-dependent Lon protease n=1 Tax=Riemerella anatipestifer TaxID=34085 RepID=UPI0007EDADF7|nr:ATP-dependent Lon protease [Riemerella anatipestifer]MBT0554298.1 ATP-dependent Lon protease [Riemerella anatipestifer]MCE3024965.1 ATP-dependent Lon protease [Riemerella anatipestifer]MCU7582044.1 ATP-dependent Lon protease [Riemerella anatipestifer]MCW0485113.1 ATP-dependent Lon protease [Riemerella anatipestifer]MDR7782906.1 ATP-dependent Lon protease [Riemerella anatipestifer]
MKKRISLPSKYHKILREEFGVTQQTITNALKYFTESELAQNIRKRAKECLKKEIDEIEI